MSETQAEINREGAPAGAAFNPFTGPLPGRKADEDSGALTAFELADWSLLSHLAYGIRERKRTAAVSRPFLRRLVQAYADRVIELAIGEEAALAGDDRDRLRGRISARLWLDARRVPQKEDLLDEVLVGALSGDCSPGLGGWATERFAELIAGGAIAGRERLLELVGAPPERALPRVVSACERVVERALGAARAKRCARAPGELCVELDLEDAWAPGAVRAAYERNAVAAVALIHAEIAERYLDRFAVGLAHALIARHGDIRAALEWLWHEQRTPPQPLEKSRKLFALTDRMSLDKALRRCLAEPGPLPGSSLAEQVVRESIRRMRLA